MGYALQLDGFEGRDIAVEMKGIFSAISLVADGAPAPKGEKNGEFLLTRNDGHPVVARFRSVFFLDPIPHLVVDGKTYQVAEPLKWYQWLWSGIPILLYFSGGALGVLLGSIGLFTNARLFRSKLTPLLKYAATSVVTFLTVAAFYLSVVLLQTGLDEWFPQTRTIRSEEGRFSIVAPIALQASTQDVNLDTGDVLPVHSFAGDRKGVSYLVAFADYPAGVVRTVDAQLILEGARDGAVQNINGTIAESHPIALGTHPGIEFTADVRDDKGNAFTLTGRMYLVDLRIYEVLAFIPAGSDAGEDVTRFFSSFNVIE